MLPPRPPNHARVFVGDGELGEERLAFGDVGGSKGLRSTGKMSTLMQFGNDGSGDDDNELWGELMGVTSKNESVRLEALERARLDQIGASTDIDNMLIMAKRLFDVDECSVVVVNATQSIVIATTCSEVPKPERRHETLCAYVVAQDSSDVFVELNLPVAPTMQVKGTLAWARYKNSVSFYAAAPLETEVNGEKVSLGSLSIRSSRPRAEFSDCDRSQLKQFARSMMQQLDSMQRHRVEEAKAEAESKQLEEVTSKLKQHSSFSSNVIHHSLLHAFAVAIMPRTVYPGEYVCKVGDAGDSMYFVISGSLSVSLGDHELEVLHAGQCFGEGAMLSLVKSLDSGLRKDQAMSTVKRGADVVALKESLLYSFSLDAGYPILRRVPAMMAALENLAKRNKSRIQNEVARAASKEGQSTDDVDDEKNVNLFKIDFDTACIKNFFELTTSRTYKEGDELCDASQVADTIYIVHKGQAQVCVKGAAVTTLDQGFSIGTAEVLQSFREFNDSPAKKKPADQSRLYSVTACSDMLVSTLTLATLIEEVKEFPLLPLMVENLVTKHLRRTSCQDVSDADDRTRKLKKNFIFKSSAADESCIRMLAKATEERRYTQGDIVAKAGDPGDKLFFIIEGSVSKALDGKVVEELKERQSVGKCEFLDIIQLVSQGLSINEASQMCVRMTDLHANKDTLLYILSIDKGEPLMRRVPVLKLALQSARHVQVTSDESEVDAKERLRINDVTEQLLKITPFVSRQVDRSVVRMVAQKCRPRTAQQGEYITRVGEPGGSLYIVREGEVMATLDDKVLELLGPGQCFGEAAMMHVCRLLETGLSMSEARQIVRRQANVVAVEQAQLYELPMEDAWDVMKLSSNMMASLKDMNNLRRRNMIPQQTFDPSDQNATAADGQGKAERPVGGGASPASAVANGYLSRVASDYSETTQASDTLASASSATEEDSLGFPTSENPATGTTLSYPGIASPDGSQRESE